MWTRSLAGGVALLFAVAGGKAAPAPLAPDKVPQAVLAVPPGADLEALMARLALPVVLDDALRSGKVPHLSCLRRVKDGRAWLLARTEMKPDREGKAVRVRIVGCPPKEGLELLTALVERALNRDRLNEAERCAAQGMLEEARRRLDTIRRVEARGGRIISRQDVERAKADVTRFAAELIVPQVLQKPDLVNARD